MISSVISFTLLFSALLKVCYGVTCRYYPSYPSTLTYFTTSCSGRCCSTAYPISASLACCSSVTYTSDLLWLYITAPIVGAFFICCVVICIIVCVCLNNKNRRRGRIITTMPQNGAVIVPNQSSNINYYPPTNNIYSKPSPSYIQPNSNFNSTNPYPPYNQNTGIYPPPPDYNSNFAPAPVISSSTDFTPYNPNKY